MFNKFIFTLSTSFLLACTALFAASTHKEAPLDPAALYLASELWPERCQLLADWTPPQPGARAIPSDRIGVFIRLEQLDGQVVAVVDYNRLGLHRIPLLKTDVLTRAEAIRAGEVTKEFPNWTMMLGRGFSKLAPEAGALNIELKALLPYNQILFVYIDRIDDSLPELAAQIHQLTDLLEQSKTIAVVYSRGDLAASGLSPLLKGMREKDLDALAFMAPHIAEPYAQSIDHAVPGFPALVLTDTEGKLLYEPGTSPKGLNSMFVAVREILRKSQESNDPGGE